MPHGRARGRAYAPQVRACLALFVLLSLASTAHAQSVPEGPPSAPAQEEPPTHEEAERAQEAASEQADAAAAAQQGGEEDAEATAPAEEPEHEPGLLDDADHPERAATHRRTRVTAQVFPETTPRQAEPEPDPETEELTLPPLPEPEWRLRFGAGIGLVTSGSSTVAARLTEEWEWLPRDATPLLFGLTAGQIIGGEAIYGLGGIRLGLYGHFCEDRIVRCTGVVSLRGGVVATANSISPDIGGDGDARFRFDGVELTIRLGFVVVGATTYIDVLGMVGAAF